MSQTLQRNLSKTGNKHKSGATITVVGAETGDGAKTVYIWVNGTKKTYTLINQDATATAVAIELLIEAVTNITSSSSAGVVQIDTDDGSDLVVYVATDTADVTFTVDSGATRMAVLDDVTAAAAPALPTDGVDCGLWEYICYVFVVKNPTGDPGVLEAAIWTMDPYTLTWQKDAVVSDVDLTVATTLMGAVKGFFQNKGNRRVAMVIESISSGCAVDGFLYAIDK